MLLGKQLHVPGQSPPVTSQLSAMNRKVSSSSILFVWMLVSRRFTRELYLNGNATEWGRASLSGLKWKIDRIKKKILYLLFTPLHLSAHVRHAGFKALSYLSIMTVPYNYLYLRNLLAMSSYMDVFEFSIIMSSSTLTQTCMVLEQDRWITSPRALCSIVSPVLVS